MELLIVLGVVAFFCITSDGDTFVYKEKYGGWRTYTAPILNFGES